MQTLLVPGDEQDFGFSIWAKLESAQSTDACEYGKTATIALTLQNSKPYYDIGGGEED
jgi:hypothetical protein